MSVKKLLVLSAAGVASLAMTAALAGGPDVAPSDNGVYLEGNIGYAYTAYSDTYGVPGLFTSNSNGGFSFGVDLGYQWNEYLAIEGGYFYLPRARWATATATGNVTSWIGYLAGKLSAPLPWFANDNFDVFFKGGLAYRQVTRPGVVVPTVGTFPGGNNNYLRPMFAVGGQYHFDENWSANVQWAHVAGVSSQLVPDANLFTVGVGYMFQM